MSLLESLTRDDLIVAAGLRIRLDYLRRAALDERVCFIVPANVLKDVLKVYGTPVIHADVPEPMIGVPGEAP